MGRRKPHKTKRERKRHSHLDTVLWGTRMEPHPVTGEFELTPTAPPETREFFQHMEELLPLYGGSVSESAAQPAWRFA